MFIKNGAFLIIPFLGIFTCAFAVNEETNLIEVALNDYSENRETPKIITKTLENLKKRESYDVIDFTQTMLEDKQKKFFVGRDEVSNLLQRSASSANIFKQAFREKEKTSLDEELCNKTIQSSRLYIKKQREEKDKKERREDILLFLEVGACIVTFPCACMCALLNDSGTNGTYYGG